jgi:hypothetical protein
MKISTLFATVLLITSLSATAGEVEAAAERVMPSFSASRNMTVTAQVYAINHETREVTLTGPEGNQFNFVASEEARNLGQVSVGDNVYAEVFEEVTINLVEAEGAEAGAGELAAMARTEEGDMPGAMVVDTQIVTMTVEEIDIEANTFKLKGPEGNVQQFEAQNPENLKLAKVGDLVVITRTSAIAISVEHPEAE